MAQETETISTETIYKGRIFDIRVDEIREGEIEYKREVVVHNGSAVIVPVFADMTVGLVRQYRHAAGKYLLEVKPEKILARARSASLKKRSALLPQGSNYLPNSTSRPAF